MVLCKLRSRYDNDMDQFPAGARRIAFFGGSFDPPHLGHLAVARAARTAFSLDAVLFAPVGAQPLKPRGSTATFSDRLEMTRLAIAVEPGFAVSLADAPNGSGTPNYTLDTLRRIRHELPEDGTLFCLMGADSFLSLHRWHGAVEIPFAAQLVVASRPSAQPLLAPLIDPLDDLAAALPSGLSIEPAPELAPPPSAIELRSYRLRNPSGETAPFFMLPGLHVEISATDIRGQVRSAASLRGRPPALPESVAEYIRSHGLYR